MHYKGCEAQVNKKWCRGQLLVISILHNKIGGGNSFCYMNFFINYNNDLGICRANLRYCLILFGNRVLVDRYGHNSATSQRKTKGKTIKILQSWQSHTWDIPIKTKWQIRQISPIILNTFYRRCYSYLIVIWDLPLIPSIVAYNRK